MKLLSTVNSFDCLMKRTSTRSELVPNINNDITEARLRMIVWIKRIIKVFLSILLLVIVKDTT